MTTYSNILFRTSEAPVVLERLSQDDAELFAPLANALRVGLLETRVTTFIATVVQHMMEFTEGVYGLSGDVIERNDKKVLAVDYFNHTVALREAFSHNLGEEIFFMDIDDFIAKYAK